MTLVILGAGGHGSDILSLVEEAQFSRPVVLLDEGVVDESRFAGRTVEIVSDAQHIVGAAGEVEFVGGVGYPSAREAFVARATAWGWRPHSALVHSSTQVMAGLEVGVGTAIMGLVWISPQVRIAEHVYIGYGVKVGHDVEVGAYSSIFPGVFLAGNVTVGEGAMVGANATVLPGLSIGDGARVGAGAVVTTDVEPGTTVVGAPAS